MSILNDPQIEITAKRLKALSQPVRLAIVCALIERDYSVNALRDRLHTSQPNISNHLQTLFEQNLVQSTRKGNQVIYRLADQRLIELIQAIQTIYCK